MADLHVVMHVPKTGGQTIRDHLRQHLAFHYEFIHLGPFGEGHARAIGLAPWQERSREDRAGALVLLGHHANIDTPKLAPGNPRVKFSAMFREPAARLVSHYNFHVEIKRAKTGKDVLDWDYWYRGQKRNFVCRWIKQNFLLRSFDDTQSDEALFAEIAEALDSFWLLGTMPHFHAFVSRLYADIGVPPPSDRRSNIAGRDYPARISVTEEIRDAVYRDHPVDCAIYDMVHARAERTLGPTIP